MSRSVIPQLRPARTFRAGPTYPDPGASLPASPQQRIALQSLAGGFSVFLL